MRTVRACASLIAVFAFTHVGCAIPSSDPSEETAASVSSGLGLKDCNTGTCVLLTSANGKQQTRVCTWKENAEDLIMTATCWGRDFTGPTNTILWTRLLKPSGTILEANETDYSKTGTFGESYTGYIASGTKLCHAQMRYEVHFSDGTVRLGTLNGPDTASCSY